VLAQPVAEFETVTVYVPVAVTVGFADEPPETIPGPAQMKLVPDTVAAERESEVIVHVSVPPEALAPGGEVLLLTDAVAVLVHPFAEFVTVTEYVPVALTIGFAVDPPEAMPGPAQLKFVPDVVAAERTIEATVHVSVPPVALAPGDVVEELTEAVAVLEQPLDELLIVTV
jgi:hypothetical protein